MHIRQADLFGFSNGGTIALQVAIRHPQVVRKLVVAVGFFSHDGADPAFWNGFATATLDVMPKELRDAYLEVDYRTNARRMRRLRLLCGLSTPCRSSVFCHTRNWPCSRELTT